MRALALWLLSMGAVLTPAARAQQPPQATLRTADAAIELSAGDTQPQLLSLRGRDGTTWRNQAAEPLPPFIQREGRNLPLTWKRVPRLCTIEPTRIVFVYESQQPHLRLQWEWQARAASGPFEHRIEVQNLSTVEGWLPVFDSLHLSWQADPTTALTHLFIDKGAGKPTAVGTHQVPLAPGYTWTGWSTTFAHPEPGQPAEIIPYQAVFTDRGGQSGWYTGIEFSGRTRITLTRSGNNVVSEIGLDPSPGPALTRLRPGGVFNPPTVFLGAFTGGPDGAGNQLRPWVRAVLGSPHTWHDPHYPLTVSNSWGVGMQIDEAVAHRMIVAAAALGFEMFHLDAGWFRGVGDWYPDPHKFPHGLAALADDAHRHALRFGLWVDWTQAGLDTQPGALNARDPAVRDWLVADIAPDWKPQDFKGQTIDLGDPPAAHYAEREVNRIVADDRLDMLEHDGYLVAQGCTRDDHPHAPPDTARMSVDHYDGEDIVLSSNSTDVSLHAVDAYYGIYERLRRAHPGLLLEICNDGGRMVDFGSAAHGDYFSITDSYDPLSNRRAFYDASYVLPPAMLETYVEKWPAPTRDTFLYELRSGMMGWVSLMQDTSEWTQPQRDAARSAIATYKSQLRPLIRDARLFHIAPRPDGVHWDGMEYWNPTTRQGVVYAFRGSADGEPEHRFRLSGLNVRRKYRLHFEDRTAPDTVASGEDLMTHGLRVALHNPLSSELVFLSQADLRPPATLQP